MPCSLNCAPQRSPIPLTLAFLSQGAVWQQDHRPPQGCLWGTFRPAAAV